MITEHVLEQTHTFTPRAAVSSVGIQSEITVGEYAGMNAIRKLAGKELTNDERDVMVDSMRTYRHELSDSGIAVPLNFITRNTGEVIEMVDEMVKGEDLDLKIKSGQGYNEWGRIVTTLCDLNEGGTQSRVLLDAKPANWIVNKRTFFIDFFPPTLRDENGEIYPFIQRLYKRSKNLFNFNYGDTRGQITKLLAGARMTYPDQYAKLSGITLSVVKAKLPHLADYIESEVICGFPDMSLFYKDPTKGERRLTQLL